jgi:hypothetical protein
LSIADRVSKLGRKITPTSEDPAVQKTCIDQVGRMLPAAFTNGRMFWFKRPSNIETDKGNVEPQQKIGAEVELNL